MDGHEQQPIYSSSSLRLEIYVLFCMWFILLPYASFLLITAASLHPEALQMHATRHKRSSCHSEWSPGNICSAAAEWFQPTGHQYVKTKKQTARSHKPNHWIISTHTENQTRPQYSYALSKINFVDLSIRPVYEYMYIATLICNIMRILPVMHTKICAGFTAQCCPLAWGFWPEVRSSFSASRHQGPSFGPTHKLQMIQTWLWFFPSANNLV